jgi:SAM-dependent methyltransferase
MAAQLRAGLPGLPLVQADGNALPFAPGSADLVTYAQAWHWTDPARSVPEAVRVLRAGGALALWWNVPDPDVGWVHAQQRRFRDGVTGYHRFGLTNESARIINALGLPLRVLTDDVRWTRRVSLDEHLANLGTVSYFALLRQEERAEIFADERAELLKVFPGGIVEEPYRVDMTVAVRDQAERP